jgi:hypothetical protein
MKLPLPQAWNRSKTAALAATVLLHVLLIGWIAMLRFEAPLTAVVESVPLWFPALPPRPPPPISAERLPVPGISVEPQTVPFPVPSVPVSEGEPDRDWYGDARDAAGAIGGGPKRKAFGETPKAPESRPNEVFPPSIYPKPLARVGTTYRTPEGELILWVSDNCYISLESQSLTMQDFHKAREGIRRCNLPLGKHKPRGDFFDHLKRPKP